MQRILIASCLFRQGHHCNRLFSASPDILWIRPCRTLQKSKADRPSPDCAFLCRQSPVTQFIFHRRVSTSSTNNTFDIMCSSNQSAAFPLEAYSPPEWATNLIQIPQYRVKLAMRNTPIHRWFLPGIPEDFEVSIKRDDMTGISLSGNKIRKLEFLLADARMQGCDTVITCGGVRSNHSRTTAIAARQMGMDCHLLLRTDGSQGLKGSFSGNTLLDRMVGCHFYLLPKKSIYKTAIEPRMQQLVEYLRNSSGKKAYPIPIGGSNAVGVFGYIDCFRELLEQGIQDRFTDIVITTGSSGSLAGLAIGNYLTGSKLKITGMAVCDDASFFHGEINRVLKELGLHESQGSSGTRSEVIVDVVEGVKGLGYGISQPEELECIEEVALTTGVFVDPVYTGKATYHLIKLIKENPGRFQGKKILFIHTGGTFDLFGKFESVMEAKSPAENKVYNWMELTDTPPISQ